jgi:hypothetical protein
MVEKIGLTEDEKYALELKRAREITTEIINFGVSQKQILFIIKN